MTGTFQIQKSSKPKSNHGATDFATTTSYPITSFNPFETGRETRPRLLLLTLAGCWSLKKSFDQTCSAHGRRSSLSPGLVLIDFLSPLTHRTIALPTRNLTHSTVFPTGQIP